MRRAFALSLVPAFEFVAFGVRPAILNPPLPVGAGGAPPSGNSIPANELILFYLASSMKSSFACTSLSNAPGIWPTLYSVSPLHHTKAI